MVLGIELLIEQSAVGSSVELVELTAAVLVAVPLPAVVVAVAVAVGVAVASDIHED